MIASSEGEFLLNGEVLIVEDDDLLRNLMVEILSDIGGGCVAFGTADDALIYLLRSHRDCTLLIADHGVPGQLLGSDLAKMVREKWPETAVILTSGYELNPDDLPPKVRYLQKPWAVDSLIMVIDELVHQDNATLRPQQDRNS